MKPAAWATAAVLALVLSAHPAGAQLGFRLPLAAYPENDNCLAWGGQNPNFPRCELPGLHVADDACVPNGTPVYMVAHGWVRYASQVGTCANNWGWVIVTEHELADHSKVCVVYGHCKPLATVYAGMGALLRGTQIATVENTCLPHIHFGIYVGAFGVTDGNYPAWLLGYLPAGPCTAYPVALPGGYVDPVLFVSEHPVAAEPVTWGRVKALYR
jgi:hypothetical protein